MSYLCNLLILLTLFLGTNVGLAQSTVRGRKDLSINEDESMSNTDAMSRLKDQEQPSEVEIERIRDIGPIGPTRHILGALVGTYPGLGLGHAIQGRYKYDGGGLYTIYDLIVFPVVAAIMSMTNMPYYSLGKSGIHCYRSKSVFTSGGKKRVRERQDAASCLQEYLLAGLLISPKFFQIYSVIIDPFEINSKYSKYRKMKLISSIKENSSINLFARPYTQDSTDDSPNLEFGLTLSTKIF